MKTLLIDHRLTEKELRSTVNVEYWRQVGKTNYYFSTLGRYYNSISKMVSYGHPTPDGYQIVKNHQINRTSSVHRSVYELFVGDIPDGMQIDHIDDNRANNNVYNLRVVTPLENTRKVFAEGHNKNVAGKNNPMYGRKQTKESRAKMSATRTGMKLSESHRRNIGCAQEKPVLCVEENKSFRSAKEAARHYGAYGNNISQCCNGIRKTCHGFHWKFIERTEYENQK